MHCVFVIAVIFAFFIHSILYLFSVLYFTLVLSVISLIYRLFSLYPFLCLFPLVPLLLLPAGEDKENGTVREARTESEAGLGIGQGRAEQGKVEMDRASKGKQEVGNGFVDADKGEELVKPKGEGERTSRKKLSQVGERMSLNCRAV